MASKSKKGYDDEIEPVTPQTDPSLVVTPAATGKAAALVARDNAILDRKLEEKRRFREEAEAKRIKEPVLDYEIRAAEAARKETEALNLVEENAKPLDKDFEAKLDYELRAEVAARKETILARHEEVQAIEAEVEKLRADADNKVAELEGRPVARVESRPARVEGSFEQDNNAIASTNDAPETVSKVAPVKAVKTSKPKVSKAKK